MYTIGEPLGGVYVATFVQLVSPYLNCEYIKAVKMWAVVLAKILQLR